MSHPAEGGVPRAAAVAGNRAFRLAVSLPAWAALADLYISHYAFARDAAAGPAPGWKYAAAFILAAIMFWAWIKESYRDNGAAACARFLCVPFGIGLALYYGAPKSFTDTAYFGGDTWEYQSLAVNLAKGHGLNTFGGIEDFSVYKFSSQPREDYASLKTEFEKNGAKGGSFDSLRTPGYPVFLAAIYCIYGVSPAAAKQAQFLMLIIIAAAMPYFGYVFWGAGGAAAGIYGAHIFMDVYAEGMARDILTEPLTAFIAFLAIAFYLRLGREPGRLNAFAFGAVVALNPLVKGTLIFVPPLFFAYIFFKAWKGEPLGKTGQPPGISVMAWMAAGFLAAAAPWSAYATFKTGSFVLFSTQAKSIIQDNNNESAFDGDWHPEGAAKFYEQPEIKKLPLAAQAAGFYASHMEMIPGIFFNKINRGFEEYLSLKITLVFIICEAAAGALRAFAGGRAGVLKTAGYVLPGALAAALAYMYFGGGSGLPTVHIFMLTAAGLMILNFAKGRSSVSLPAPFAVFIINMILVTLITYGSTRFTGALAFIYITSAAGYTASFITPPFRSLARG